MSLNGIGRITEGMSEEQRRAFLLTVLARNERARADISGTVRLIGLSLAREMIRPRFWLLVAVVAFLAWLSGYDVR